LRYKPYTLQQFHPDLEVSRLLEQTFEEQEKLATSCDDINVATAPRCLFAPLTGHRDPMRRIQPWYEGDLHQANKNIIPLFNPKDSLRQLTFIEKIKIISDVAQALEAMGKKKLIHGDVRPWNILIKKDSDKGLMGVLNDFDCMQTEGIICYPVKLKDINIYLDHLTRLGCLTNFTDIYSLCIVLAETVIPHFGKQLEPIIIPKFQGKLSEFLLEQQANYLFDYIQINKLPFNFTKCDKFCVKNQITKLKDDVMSIPNPNNSQSVLKIFFMTFNLVLKIFMIEDKRRTLKFGGPLYKLAEYINLCLEKRNFSATDMKEEINSILNSWNPSMSSNKKQ
jgi:hypothetical protein